jgi:hypothetical protein
MCVYARLLIDSPWSSIASIDIDAQIWSNKFDFGSQQQHVGLEILRAR